MRKMKPFGGTKRKYAEGGDTGVREGRNRNIDDATRQRALDRMEAQRVLESMKADEPKAKPKAAPMAKAAPKATDTGDETARLAKRPPVDPGYRKGTLEDPEYRKKLEKDQALKPVAPEELIPGLGGLGLAARAARAAAGAKAGLRTVLSNQKALPAPPKKPELSAPAKKDALPAPDKKPQLGGPEAQKRLAAPAKKEPVKPAPRNRDEERMSGEGGGFRKGGSVRGCGIARKGLTKGKMR